MQIGPITLDELKRTLLALPNKESEVEGDVPIKVLKLTFNTRTGGGLRITPSGGGGAYNAPPSISAPMRANATNFGGI